MYKKTLSATLFLLCAATTVAADLVIDPDVDRQARVWVRHIDEAAMGQAWSVSSELLKAAVTKSDWEKSLKRVAIFGNVRTRVPSAVTFATKMEGMPDGAYAVIRYDTVFSGKDNASELVTLCREADGAWRGVGYRLQ